MKIVHDCTHFTNAKVMLSRLVYTLLLSLMLIVLVEFKNILFVSRFQKHAFSQF